MTRILSAEPPNVLVVCNIFRPLATTGIEILRVELTRRYRSVRPVVLTGEYDPHPDAEAVPVEVHSVPILGTTLLGRARSALAHRYANVMIDRAMSLLPTVRRLCREHDIRCIEYGNSNLGFLGYLAHHWLGIPYAVWVNSSEDPVVAGTYGNFSRPISRLAFKHAAAIITPSYSTQQYVRSRVQDPERVHAVQMGVDVTRFSPGPLDPPADLAPLLRGRSIMLSVSRLVESKGIDTVIQAVPAIAAAVPNVTYVIAGDRPDRIRLEAMTRELKLEDRVIFAGRRSGDELIQLYRSCRLFVLVSRFQEGLGMAALEAAACEKPVIVGDRGGQPETVEDGVTGYCVPAESVQAVAEACIDILSNPDRASAMGRAGRDLAAKMSWDTAASAVESRLLAIMEQGSGDDSRAGAAAEDLRNEMR